MKKVIFVGGTAFSGSTFFDMTLANDPKGFSCGEVNAVFYPYRRKHLDVQMLSDEINWSYLKKGGAENLYQNIFNMFPEVEFIVDSSKSPLWISERTKELEKKGIDVRNILIWKYPSEFKKSRVKRGREKGWTRGWINYHKYYMSVVKNWRSVKYSQYVKQKEVLKLVCDVLGLDYFDGKEKFWEKKQHTLYGNTSAKIHLADAASTEFDQYGDAIKSKIVTSDAPSEREIISKHKKIYYDQPEIVKDEEIERDPRFKSIQDILEYADVSNDNYDMEYVQKMQQPLQVGQLYQIYQIIKRRYYIRHMLDYMTK